MQSFSKKKSFTLIEMLIVIVIIGILAAALIPRLQNIQLRARNVQRKVDISSVSTALNIYHSDYGKYPRGLGHLVTGNIITSLPSDPLRDKRHSCDRRAGQEGIWNGESWRLTSGFYFDTGEPGFGARGCGDGPENCSLAYNGYLYASCSANTVCKYAYVGAYMENDGTTNSYGGYPNTGAQILCNWRNNRYQFGTNNYNVFGQAINEAANGLNAKGKIFYHIFDNGTQLY